MGAVSSFIGDFLNNIYRPNVEFSDIAEILIIAFFLYHIILWMKTSRAWTLLKGILVIIIFALIAYLCKFTTILWIAGKTINVALIAVVVIFQPELRKALEQLGNKRYLAGLLQFDDLKDKKEIFSDRTIDELVKASYEMAKHKTGALIVIELEINLQDYINTGIDIDAFESKQLLISNCSIERDTHPIVFIHMKSWIDRRMIHCIHRNLNIQTFYFSLFITKLRIVCMHNKSKPLIIISKYK